MDAARRQRAVNMLDLVRTDIERDVAATEGAPFTGAQVAADLGKIRAQVDALARVLQAMLQEDE